MGDRGITLVELLVVIVIAAIVILGAGLFYSQMTQALNQGHAQAALQRHGTLVQEEMAKFIQAANEIRYDRCGPPTATSQLGVWIPPNVLTDLQLYESGGLVCFYLEANQVFECRYTSYASPACITDTVRNLLEGNPTPDVIRATSLTFTTPGPGGVPEPPSGGRYVDVSFTIQTEWAPGRVSAGPLTFSTRLGIKVSG